MPRMVVTGREGQVVRSLIGRSAENSFEVVPLGRPTLDLAGQSDAIIAAVKSAEPDIIVAAAAYTLVDKAEGEPDLAFAVNAHGAGAVARAAHDLRVPLIHLSTDYVFDGNKGTPYVEEDLTGPTGIYGASKLAGEQAVSGVHSDSVILRTAWVYSEFGANFMRTMLRLAGECEEISVVADQRGNPTYAGDIADGIFAVASNLLDRSDRDLRGIFHLTGGGEASWAEFASQTFEESIALAGPGARVKAIATADYPTLAKRPANSRLDSNKLAQVHGVRLPDWRASVKDVVRRLVEGAAAARSLGE